MPIRRSAKIPEPILQLQQQLDQWRGAQKGRTKLPESFWQAAVDLARQYGVFRTAQPLRLDYTRLKQRLSGAGRSESLPAGICGTGQAAARRDGRVRHRVRVGAGRQDARSVEIQHSTGLDEPVAGLAGWRPVIQITAQMRVLVAIEPVDGRKGIDSLVRLCQDKLAEDPFSGCVFVFRSRQRDGDPATHL